MENNPPAFPILKIHTSHHGIVPLETIRVHDEGMTLRDYFAARAMQGFISNAEHWASVWAKSHPKSMGMSELSALASYSIADAMLEARKS